MRFVVGGLAVAALILIVVAILLVLPRDEVTVPSVDGLSLADATATLEGAGLKVEPTTVPANGSPVGTIVGQRPEGGTAATKGSIVTLFVAGTPGPAPLVEVPSLIGMTRAKAIAALEARDLNASTHPVEQQGGEIGLVKEQEPAAGSTVPVGSVVELGISRNAEVPPNPIAWVLGLGVGAPEGPRISRLPAAAGSDDCRKLERSFRPRGGRPQQDQERLYGAAADACIAATAAAGAAGRTPNERSGSSIDSTVASTRPPTGCWPGSSSCTRRIPTASSSAPPRDIRRRVPARPVSAHDMDQWESG
jgi:hypothetical protein